MEILIYMTFTAVEIRLIFKTNFLFDKTKWSLKEKKMSEWIKMKYLDFLNIYIILLQVIWSRLECASAPGWEPLFCITNIHVRVGQK